MTATPRIPRSAGSARIAPEEEALALLDASAPSIGAGSTPAARHPHPDVGNGEAMPGHDAPVGFTPCPRPAIAPLRVARADPAIAAAHRPTLGGPTLRIQIQSRLPAGQDDARIAETCGLGAEVVAAYATLVSDVGPFLDRRDALLFAAFGEQLHDVHGGGPEVALTLLAYLGGPVAADALLPGLRLDEAGVPVLADAHLDGHFRNLVDVRAIPTGAHGAILAIRLHTHLSGRESAAALAPPGLAERLRTHAGGLRSPASGPIPAGPTILAATTPDPVAGRSRAGRAAG
ncbi:MAG: hypothetical protein JWN86_1829 [Planctomycetota bacterium]|nr:hypothetical protein [Planctomycetota bacterium]